MRGVTEGLQVRMEGGGRSSPVRADRQAKIADLSAAPNSASRCRAQDASASFIATGAHRLRHLGLPTA